MEKYEETLQNDGKRRYREKLNLLGIKCPYKLEENRWIDKPTEWPQLNYHHLYHYLIKSPSMYIYHFHTLLIYLPTL